MAAERGEIEEVVRAAGRLEAARVLRVGVEHAPVDLEEAASARHFEWLVRVEEVLPHGLELGLGAVVVLARPDRLIDRDAEVVVEVGSE